MTVHVRLPHRRERRKLQAWEAPNSRWYWHLKVSGRVKDHGDYASRRSMRRALAKMFPGLPIEVLTPWRDRAVPK